MEQPSARTAELRRAKRVVIYGSVLMSVMIALLYYGGLSAALLLVGAFGAVAVLVGYIWMALELAPKRAMSFGAETAVLTIPVFLLLAPLLYAVSMGFPGSFDLHDSAIIWAALIIVFLGSGTGAFLVGLVRYWHMTPAKPKPR